MIEVGGGTEEVHKTDLDWTWYELHSLGPVSEPASPAVATSEHTAIPGHEGRVEFLEGDLADVDILLPERLHQVRHGAVGVGAEAEIVVGV